MQIGKQMNKKNKKGEAHLLIFVAVAVVVAVLLYMFFSETTPSVSPVTDETSEIITPDPISSSDELDIIEVELNETITGFPEAQIDELERDTSSL